MKVDLLFAEAEREALFGRRPERDELHAEHFRVETDAGRLVARGEDDVVDMVDHGATEREDAPAPRLLQLAISMSPRCRCPPPPPCCQGSCCRSRPPIPCCRRRSWTRAPNSRPPRSSR